METMKYPNVPGGNNMAVSGNGGSHVEDVETVFSSSCWSNSSTNLHNEFIDQKLMSLESPISNLSAADKMLEASITESESDALDSFLMNTQPINSSLAELKPLPPFAGYTANLSINGIQGHHYHALAQRITEENNNSYNNFNEQNIVSSSTCNVSNDNDCDTKEVLFAENEFEVKLSYDMVDSVVTSGKVYDECGQQQNSAVDSVTHIKTEVAHYDVSAIDDIAAIISSAISADTSAAQQQQQQQNNNATSHCGESEHNPTSRDSWMDLDSWINRACVDEQKNLIVTQEGLSEFVVPTTTNQTSEEFKSPNSLATPTLQNLLSYMPLLQNRLQNGPPPKQELPSSTNYTGDIISTSSPPANVVSTTENLLLTVNGRFVPNYGIQHLNAAQDDRMQSPDMLQNYPHTTTTTTTVTPKKSRNRTQKKQTNNSASVYPSEQNLGLLGKEKPVHRCTICNRGFLNKSNIKVHLRTHTGEKPFRCDTCAKAFRQKAHLLKHQQIHKRIGRD
ncbi:ichor [Onthophagus taurus]|uniref:ichor n=1 Tax=Onthophagus taurus TaxID=166361 RepID=UPI000C208DD8|nr:ras guanine nucleotide exchange factor E [Onthophagus taurus]